MEWILVELEPKGIGKYVVETKTTLGNIRRLEACWNGISWNVSNQIVIRWLKE